MWHDIRFALCAGAVLLVASGNFPARAEESNPWRWIDVHPGNAINPVKWDVTQGTAKVEKDSGRFKATLMDGNLDLEEISGTISGDKIVATKSLLHTEPYSIPVTGSVQRTGNVGDPWSFERIILRSDDGYIGLMRTRAK